MPLAMHAKKPLCNYFAIVRQKVMLLVFVLGSRRADAIIIGAALCSALIGIVLTFRLGALALAQ
jgi:hypothetical protein